MLSDIKSGKCYIVYFVYNGKICFCDAPNVHEQMIKKVESTYIYMYR